MNIRILSELGCLLNAHCRHFTSNKSIVELSNKTTIFREK